MVEGEIACYSWLTAIARTAGYDSLMVITCIFVITYWGAFLYATTSIQAILHFSWSATQHHSRGDAAHGWR